MSNTVDWADRRRKIESAAHSDNPFQGDSACSTVLALYRGWEHRRIVAKTILNGGFENNDDAYYLFERHNENIKQILGL